RTQLRTAFAIAKSQAMAVKINFVSLEVENFALTTAGEGKDDNRDQDIFVHAETLGFCQHPSKLSILVGRQVALSFVVSAFFHAYARIGGNPLLSDRVIVNC